MVDVRPRILLNPTSFGIKLTQSTNFTKINMLKKLLVSGFNVFIDVFLFTNTLRTNRVQSCQSRTLLSAPS